MSIKQALANKETKNLIEQIQDVQSSLESYPEGEVELETILGNLTTELAALGYNW